VWIYKRVTGKDDKEDEWKDFYYDSIRSAAKSLLGTPCCSRQNLQKKLQGVDEEERVKLNDDLWIIWVPGNQMDCLTNLYRISDVNGNVIREQLNKTEVATEVGVSETTIHKRVSQKSMINSTTGLGRVLVERESKDIGQSLDNL
jgi:hypothetical protein